MENISVLEKTKNYVVIKLPCKLFERMSLEEESLTQGEALKILRKGMDEYRKGKTKLLTSLAELRHGD